MVRNYIKKGRKRRDPLPAGPIKRDGSFSIDHRDERLRRNPGVKTYLKRLRRDLIRDLSPEGEAHLTAARHLVLDRLLQKVATVRIIEEWLAEHGFVRRDKLAQTPPVLDSEPIMKLWLTLNSQIREDVRLLGLDRQAIEVTDLSPLELAAAVDAEDAELVDDAGDCSTREAFAPHTATHGETDGESGSEGEGE